MRTQGTLDYLQPMSVSLGLPGSLSQGSYALLLGAFQIKHLHICVILDCKHKHHFSATHDGKINNCGFRFSVACEWHVLIEEDKDNSLQFAPTKFIKLPIPQS